MISTTGSRLIGGCLASIVLAAFAACGGTQGVASKYVKTASVGAAGGTITITSSDDPAIAGTSITIPPHALSANTTISIGVSTVDVSTSAPGSMPAGPVIDFEPSPLHFAVPVTMTLPVALPSGVSPSHLFVEAVEADGTSKEIPATYANGIATLQVTGFTSFGVVSGGTDGGPVCSTDSDCPSGEVCVSGACTPGVTVTPDGGSDGGAACTTDSDCPVREVCVAGTCSIPTVVDAGSVCGDGVCDGSETCASCPLDCGACDGGPSDGGAADATVCPGGETACSGVCSDLTSDPANCGACAHRCPLGVCTASTCS